MDINTFAAILFLIIGILTIIKIVISKTYYNSLWFCDFAPFLFAIGFYIQSFQFIKALINIGLITQIVTIILFLYGVFSGKNIIGSKKAVQHGKFYVVIELIIHVTAILALIFTYNIAPRPISLAHTLIILSFMFIFTFLFSPKKRNVNLLYFIPLDEKKKVLNLPFYTPLWIVYALIASYFGFLLQYFLYIFTGA